MTDPGEEICDALVAYLNGLIETTPTTFDYEFEAEKPQDIQAEFEREHADLKVCFAPFSETEEKTDRGGNVLETIEVTMMVVRRLDGNATRPQLNGLVRGIRTKLRGQAMAGYKWTAAETVTKYNPEQTSTSQQFTNVTRLRYVGMSGPS